VFGVDVPAAIVEPHAHWRVKPVTTEAEGGFTDFYRLERDSLVRALGVTLADRDLATEAVDEAMARAYARWDTVRRMDRPAGWVYRVALNWSRSVVRRRRRPRRALHDIDGAEQPGVRDPAVAAALAELKVDFRAVVVCRHLFGWSEEETATALDIPVGTVKSRLSRANQQLSQRLAHLDPRSTT
jgi:RNA polymerase sigma factor (sigma-70 family)